MDRKDWFYKQKVLSSEMDAAETYAEQADWNNRVDDLIYGAITGLVPSLGSAPTLDVTKGIAIDQLGRRVKAYSDGASTKNHSYATATDGTPTSVSGGQERWISIYANYGRQALDPRVDGNSNTVYFDQPENLHDGTTGPGGAGVGGTGVDKLRIIAGTSAPTGTATKPALLTDAILLCDIKRTPGDASNVLDTTRRMAFAIADTAQVGTGASAGNGLAILMSAFSAWLGGRTNPAQASLHAQIDKIFTDLATTTATDDGAERIGAQTSGNLPSGSVRSQLDTLDSIKPNLSTSNTFTGSGNTQTIAGAVSVGTTLGVTGNETVGGSLTLTGQFVPAIPADETTAVIKPSGTVPSGKYRLLFETDTSTIVGGGVRIYLAYHTTSLTASDGFPVFGNSAIVFVIGAYWDGSVWHQQATAGSDPIAFVLPLTSASDGHSGLVVLSRHMAFDSNSLTFANTFGVTTGWTKVARFGLYSSDSSNVGEPRAGTSSLQLDTGIWIGVPGSGTYSAGLVPKTYYLGARGYNTTGARIAGRETLLPKYTATPTLTTLTAESNSNAGSITIDAITATDIKWSFSVTSTGDANSYSRLEVA